MYVELNTDNRLGWTCSWCNKSGTDVDMLYVGGLNKPFICTTCLRDSLVNNELDLTEHDASTETTCDNCEEVIAVGDATYCYSCYESQYESGLESAMSTCSYCGDDGDVYCINHAKSEWELVELGAGDIYCDECNTDDASTTLKFLCEDCLAKVSVPDVTYAQAAEPIEVSWGDEDE